MTHRPTKTKQLKDPLLESQADQESNIRSIAVSPIAAQSLTGWALSGSVAGSRASTHSAILSAGQRAIKQGTAGVPGSRTSNVEAQTLWDPTRGRTMSAIRRPTSMDSSTTAHLPVRKARLFIGWSCSGNTLSGYRREITAEYAPSTLTTGADASIPVHQTNSTLPLRLGWFANCLLQQLQAMTCLFGWSQIHFPGGTVSARCKPDTYQVTTGV